jgi:hypothetical protein
MVDLHLHRLMGSHVEGQVCHGVNPPVRVGAPSWADKAEAVRRP